MVGTADPEPLCALWGLWGLWCGVVWCVVKAQQMVGVDTTRLFRALMESAAGNPLSKTELLVQLIEGARYEELDELEAALAGGVEVDGTDEQGRTGVCGEKVNAHTLKGA